MRLKLPAAMDGAFESPGAEPLVFMRSLKSPTSRLQRHLNVLALHNRALRSNCAYCGESQYAEFEREMIRERTVSGVRAAKAKGKKLGRPKRVFRRDEVVRLRKSGQSWREIAKQLGVPVSTIVDSSRDKPFDPEPGPARLARR